MKNIYVTRYRDIIKDFHTKMNNVDNEMKSEIEKYSDDYKIEVIQKYEQKKQKLKNEAVQRIINLNNTVIDCLAVSSVPNVEQITADVKIFENSMMDLSPAEVDGFIDRYKNNPTMLRMIKKWLETRHNADDWKSDYSALYKKIVSPADMASVYKFYAESALGLINRIYDSPNISVTFIDSYGDETVGAELLSKIGDGLNITDYKNKKTYDSVSESFSVYRISESNYVLLNNAYSAE